MSERTLADALAHAEGVRHYDLPSDDHHVILERKIVAELHSDIVLLADEIKRLTSLTPMEEAWNKSLENDPALYSPE